MKKLTNKFLNTYEYFPRRSKMILRIVVENEMKVEAEVRGSCK